MKKVLAFDLDGTLAPSKSYLPPRMGELLDELLNHFDICVISGGKFGQFETQLLQGLPSGPDKLKRLHLMPTCGTQYYKFENNGWNQMYAENFTEDEKQKIISALNEGIDTLGHREAHVYGGIIEDRGSQVTFSALGQDIVTELGDEGVRLKEAWDPDTVKKNAIRDYVSKLIPEFEVRVGGGTSIDITKPGIDKAYGMQKIMDMLAISKDEILFFGDRLAEGGNDYPVKEFGIETLEVSGWEHTARRLEKLLLAIK
jgi:HAD superfamily hydrolase (TIGR01484 family)